MIEFLQSKQEAFIVFINHNREAEEILESKTIHYEVVELSDYQSNWETTLIEKYKIDVWINDRLNTELIHAENVKKNEVLLVTFDDRGSGASLADLHFAALAFENSGELRGKKVFTGVQYLILNRQIDSFKRLRETGHHILVTMGGSDTHGVTAQVMGILAELKKRATIITGPSFQHYEAIRPFLISGLFDLKINIPSLIAEFYGHDFAITGGGITPFEANASGLPCRIIATEKHEIPNARYLESLGSSVFAGFYEQITIKDFQKELNVKEMSRIGMERIKTNAVETIFREIGL